VQNEKKGGLRKKIKIETFVSEKIAA